MRARQELKLDVDSKKKIAAATFPLLCVLEGLTLWTEPSEQPFKFKLTPLKIKSFLAVQMVQHKDDSLHEKLRI